MPNNKQDLSQFGSSKPGQSGDPRHCAQCEAMLADALDGTLSPEDQATFDLHLVGCSPCSGMMADAQRGAAWLELLKTPRPEPPAALLNRILAQTSGVASTLAPASAKLKDSSPVPINTLLGSPTLALQSNAALAPAYPSNVIPFRSRFTLRNIGQTMLQPRLAMTAAMAFFSVALTLNLTGVRLGALHASDLRPSSIKRSFSEANAHVVRYYDNLRVVYELESRVHELQGSSDSADMPAADSKAAPAQQNQSSPSPDQKNPDSDKPKPRPRPGTSRRETPGMTPHFALASNIIPASPSSAPSLSQSLVSLLPSVTLSSVDRCNLQQESATWVVQEGTLV